MAEKTPKKGFWQTFWQERIPLDMETLKHPLKEPVPAHMKMWWFALGGTPFMLFGIQVVTGILLTFYYVPSPPEAFESVRYIQEQVPFGWWIRGIHHWGATLMIFTVTLHMLRVFITGAYRRPRELNWLFGVGLLFLTLAFGFTGYSLVYNQLSFWAATVGTNIFKDVPLLGPLVLSFLRGGGEVTANTLTRFFTVHIGVLPTVMTILLLVHVVLLRSHGVAPLTERYAQRLEHDDDKEQIKVSFPDHTLISFFPDHIITEIVIGFYLVLILTSLAILFPPPLGELADPLNTPPHIKPEWYFFPIYRWLRLVPGVVGLIGLGLFIGVLTFWPVVDAFLQRRLRRVDFSVVLGSIVVVIVAAATVWEAFVP